MKGPVKSLMGQLINVMGVRVRPKKSSGEGHVSSERVNVGVLAVG